MDKEYSGMLGYEDFCKEAYKLAFGEDQNFKDNLVSESLSDVQGSVVHKLVRLGDNISLAYI